LFNPTDLPDTAPPATRAGEQTAARVAALAGPGEVLVSSTVKDVVAGSGVLLAGRGTHALKGVPDERRLFAVER
jgi:class 3 adenylate cyclase